MPSMSSVMSDFAAGIMRSKRYAHEKGGDHETWGDVADRVSREVVAPFFPRLVSDVRRLIEDRVFMPGGRYLYAAGRRFHQTNNCFLLRVGDSREEWGRLMNTAVQCLMTGGGIGVVYSDLRGENTPISGMGGASTGPCALMQMVNEAGRHIVQGGSRRAAIWAGLQWDHPDVYKFMLMKNWDDSVREAKRRDFNAHAPMDGTNISVILNTDFFKAYEDPNHPKSAHAQAVYWLCVRGMCTSGEPGFSIDADENEGENCRNAPVHGDTLILTDKGYLRAAELEDVPTTVWTGKQWAQNVVFKKTAEMIPTVRVQMTGGREIVCDPTHPFLVCNYVGHGKDRRLESIDRVPAGELQEGDTLHVSLPKPKPVAVDKTAYTMGFIYGDGSFTSRQSAELTLCTEEKMQCINQLQEQLISSKSITDKGYLRIYFKTSALFKGRDKCLVPPCSTPETMASFIAGVFDADGNISERPSPMIRMSSVHKEFVDGIARMLEQLGIIANVSDGGGTGKASYSTKPMYQLVIAASYVRRFMEIIPTVRVRCDVSEYIPYRHSTIKVISVTEAGEADVYCADVKVEEHSFQAEGVIISNCTEVTSRDDEDMCNLGSINLARINSLEKMREVVELGTMFLLCGTLYSKLPLQSMHKVRERNRRIGLGLMGLHEWLLRRGKKYGVDKDLANYLDIYKQSGSFANRYADKLSVSRSVATRAIAPTGTISIVAETTSGCEPIYAVALRRRYLIGTNWKARYIVDPTAARLIQDGVRPDTIEDAVILSRDVKRRIEFQRWLQTYVDHGISSTVNLPSWGSEYNSDATLQGFGETLYKHLRGLRGITAYPDGARDGQPLTRVDYAEALKHGTFEFEDGGDKGCKDGFCSS